MLITELFQLHFIVLYGINCDCPLRFPLVYHQIQQYIKNGDLLDFTDFSTN